MGYKRAVSKAKHPAASLMAVGTRAATVIAHLCSGTQPSPLFLFRRYGIDLSAAVVADAEHI